MADITFRMQQLVAQLGKRLTAPPRENIGGAGGGPVSTAVRHHQGPDYRTCAIPEDSLTWRPGLLNRELVTRGPAHPGRPARARRGADRPACSGGCRRRPAAAPERRGLVELVLTWRPPGDARNSLPPAPFA
ncbi:hypothetical protein SFUMM280S_03101 [Streptomyces fumanus]